MVALVKSSLDIRVETREYGIIDLQTEHGTIEQLSKRFQFAVDGDSYIFDPPGRKVNIVQQGTHFYFHSFQ